MTENSDLASEKKRKKKKRVVQPVSCNRKGCVSHDHGAKLKTETDVNENAVK